MSMGSSPVFPIINYTCPINYLINNVAFNSKNKKIFFKIQISKKMISLLKLFKKYNLISSFYLVKKNIKTIVRTYAWIFPSYNKNFRINFFLKSFYIKNRRFWISLKAISLLKQKTGNSIYIISTPIGLIDQQDALYKKQSGFIFGIIHS